MGVLDRAALSVLPLLPTWLMRRLSARYIAGETLAQALDCIRRLHARGHASILDILGEDVTSEARAREVLRQYREAATALAACGVDCYVSVKPTHFGLRLSEDLCFSQYDELARHCAALNLALRVEMEDHTTTDATLRVFERLRPAHGNVGIVLQSRLKRTPADVAALAPGPLSVRMVKGIYLEPPGIAHVDPDPIRDAFVTVSRMLLERSADVAFATHDEQLFERLTALCRELLVPREKTEFQVLLGVREPLWTSWQRAGERVRVYVPFGPEWRAYSTRRLRKNPQIFRNVMRDMLLRR